MCIGGFLNRVVGAKRFLPVLAEQGTIDRIISFIVGGVLLLVVVYFSPVPPSASVDDKEPEKKAATDSE